MSELFTYKGDDEHYFIKTKNKHLTGDEVADLLNFLSEENEKLQENIMFWKQQAEQYSNDCNVLQNKNEQLREDRNVANDFIVKKGLDIEYYKHWRGLQDE